MDRRLSDEQLDRALSRILAEQGAEIEASGITPAMAAARVRLGSRRPAGLTYGPATPSEGEVGIERPAIRTRFLTMDATLRITAIAVLALAVGIGVVQLQPSTDNVGSVVSPSPSPSPLVWTPASIEQDWPAPVREEPVGEPVIIPIADEHLDPHGDIESPDMPWIDILRVMSNGRGAFVDLGGGVPPGLVVPGDPWIAYGLVFDTDLDGVADVRLGMDLVPAEQAPWGGAPGDTEARAWRTDFRSGVTTFAEANGESAADAPCDCSYPELPTDREDVFVEPYGALVTAPPETQAYRPVAKFYPYIYPTDDWFEFDGEWTMAMIPGRFYAWASVIQDGRVVATDYAPDVGWLELRVPPRPTAAPGASPLP